MELKNTKQIERMINKFVRLERIYKEFLVDKRISLNVEIYETKERFLHLPKNKSYKKITENSLWGDNFGYGWFKIDTSILEEKEYKELLSKGKLFLEPMTSAIETVAFINDEPYGMFDHVENSYEPNLRLHRYLQLPTDTKEISLEGYSSHYFPDVNPYDKNMIFVVKDKEIKRCFKGIYLVTLNNDVYDLIVNIHMLNSTYRILENDKKKELFEIYENIYKVLDLIPYDGLDLNSVRQANLLFKDLYTNDKSEELPFVSLVGHSHIDTSWLWKVEETRRKVVETATNAVRLLKRHKEYKFMLSSMLHFQWIKEDYPKLFEEIMELEKQQRFEINGATYIECDCNLVGNEAFCRQFTKGQRWMKENTNHYADCFFLPDTFGYNYAIPQLILKSNAKYFLTTKIRWNDTNRFPYETFYWQGLDGSKVLCNFNYIHSYPDPENINSRYLETKKDNVSQMASIGYGFGDGGGGPDDTMVRYAILSNKIKYLPNVKHQTISEFMNLLEKNKTDYPTYKGELYLEYHRATLTNNPFIKTLNRRLEIALHNVEVLTALLSKNKEKDKALSDKNYDVLLLNQFHDILPATCIKESTDITIEENTNSLNETNEQINDIINNNTIKDYNYYSIVNLAPFKTTGLNIIKGDIKLEGINSETFDTVNGLSTIIDLNQNEYSFKAYKKTNYLKTNESSFIKIYKNNKLSIIENTLYKIMFDDNMQITNFYNKSLNREIVIDKFNNFKIAQNVPYTYDNWDMDIDYELKLKECNNLLSSNITHDGALALVIKNTYKLTDKTILEQDMILYNDSYRIDFYNKLDWNDVHKVLKVYFNTNIKSNQIRNEIQFGNILRSTNNDTSIEQAQFEICNHKWSNLSEDKYNITILNDCKYGLSCKDSNIGLTLMTSGNHPNPDAGRGVHLFKYSIILNNAGFNSNDVIKPSYLLNNDLIVVPGKIDFNNIVKTNANNIILETIKVNEDNINNIVLRMYEAEGKHTKVTLEFDKIYELYETNIIESDLKFLTKDRIVELDMTPFNITTLILK